MPTEIIPPTPLSMFQLVLVAWMLDRLLLNRILGQNVGYLSRSLPIHVLEVARCEPAPIVLIEQVAGRGNLDDVSRKLILQRELRFASGDADNGVAARCQLRVLVSAGVNHSCNSFRIVLRGPLYLHGPPSGCPCR